MYVFDIPLQQLSTVSGNVFEFVQRYSKSKESVIFVRLSPS